MTDPLDDLAQAMRAATPTPDQDKRAADIALAKKNFATAQETDAQMRSISERAQTGPTGVFAMITSRFLKPALLGGTALAAVALVAYLPLMERPAATFENAQTTPNIAENQIQPQESLMPEPMVAMDMAPANIGIAAMPEARMARKMGAPKMAPMPMPDRPTVAPLAGETYANAPENPVKVTSQSPVSTFSVDVDTASYAMIRNSLEWGQWPDPDSVRIEEMINYFPYDYAAPKDAPFAAHVGISPSPWRPGNRILHIGVQGKTVPENRPPLNLVFLVDTSGSMRDAKKLPLLKASLSLLLGQLRAEDEVAIVTYAGSAETALAPTPATEKKTIQNALAALTSGGGTHGAGGITKAYELAETMQKTGEIGRVILATDGDFNIGIQDPDALRTFIKTKRASGTYLSVLGFGRGNMNDAIMQSLAQNGNGTAAYIDSLHEAKKALVDQGNGALFPIADDVKIQVEFNPAKVAEYRLIGYETRALDREDFNNDAVDAGDINAGHQVTALYEITPVGAGSGRVDPLRYGAEAPTGPHTDEIAFLRLRAKAPGAGQSDLIEVPIHEDSAPLPDSGFAMAIAGFGQLLRNSPYLDEWSMADAIDLALAHKGADPFGYRQDAIALMRLAQSLQTQ